MGKGFLGRLFGRGHSVEASSAKPTRPTAHDIQAFRDAFMPEDRNAGGYAIIPTDGTPEELADALIRPHLPKVFFDQIDIGTDIGKAQFLGMLFSRPRGASIEKDEVIRFVKRNEAHMHDFATSMLPAFRQAGANTEGGEALVKFIDYFGTQVRHVMEGHPERIDIKSDRLLWLIYALASQLDAGKISYDEALVYLRKPAHFDRISNLSLVFMLNDYAESVGQATQASLCYLMLVGEAARLKDMPNAASAAFAIILKTRDSGSGQNLLRYLDSQQPYLTRHRKLTVEDAAEVARLRGRFSTSVRPEDF